MSDEIVSEFGWIPAADPEEVLAEKKGAYIKLGDIFTPLVDSFCGRLSRNLPAPVGDQPAVLKYIDLPRPSTVVNIRDYKSWPTFEEVVISRMPAMLQGMGTMGLDIRVPVGEYGQSWSEVLVEATRIIYSIMLNSPELAQQADDIHISNPELVKKHTFRHSPLLTMAEGAQSLAAAASLLMARKVEGFDDPLTLYQELVEQSKFGIAARRFGSGVLFPMVIHGINFPWPVLVENLGKLDFSEDLKHFWEKERRRARKEIVGLSPLHLTYGCPVSRSNVPKPEGGIYPDSGLNIFAKATFQYVRDIYEQMS